MLASFVGSTGKLWVPEPRTSTQDPIQLGWNMQHWGFGSGGSAWAAIASNIHTVLSTPHPALDDLDAEQAIRSTLVFCLTCQIERGWPITRLHLWHEAQGRVCFGLGRIR